MRNNIRNVLLLVGLLLTCKGQAQDREMLMDSLCSMGFENVRALSVGDRLLVSLENNVFRWDVDGICDAMDVIAKDADKDQRIVLYVLDNGIPQIEIICEADKWKKYQDGKLGRKTMLHDLTVTYNLGDGWKKLKSKPVWNSNINRVDMVIYPQMALQNTGFNQIYEIQLNVAPAIEVDFWRGMTFTGQTIVPIVNDLGPEGDNVRPGFITMTQKFRLGKNYFGRIALGNFNSNRYGVDASVYKPLWNDRVEVELNVGYTGTSAFFDGQWITEPIDKITGYVKTKYYEPTYDLQMGLSFGRYLQGDYGFRGDMTRHFGSTSIGFWVLVSDGRFNGGGKFNGGFHFAVPLMFKKRKRQRTVRVLPAPYFDWEYNAGTEFEKGQYYESRPNENRTENNYNPVYIKAQMLRL